MTGQRPQLTVDALAGVNKPAQGADRIVGGQIADPVQPSPATHTVLF